MIELFHEWYVRQSALRDVTLDLLLTPERWSHSVLLAIFGATIALIIFLALDEEDDPDQPKEH